MEATIAIRSTCDWFCSRISVGCGKGGCGYTLPGMSTTIQLAVHGAAGRMGRRVVALAAENPEFEIVSAIDHADNPHLGEDAGFVAGFAAINVPISNGGRTLRML